MERYNYKARVYIFPATTFQIPKGPACGGTHEFSEVVLPSGQEGHVHGSEPLNSLAPAGRLK